METLDRLTGTRRIKPYTPGVIEAGWGRTRAIRTVHVEGHHPHPEKTPVHGKSGWVLLKYEWRANGTARFLYGRNDERRTVVREQKGWLHNG